MTRRPTTLREIAAQSDSLEDFGRHFRDWLHALRKASSKPQAAKAVAEEPRRLAQRFVKGVVADAWLAAYAELVASRTKTLPPAWAFRRTRISPDPWFADESAGPVSRILALEASPLPFKRRNLFVTSVDLPLSFHAGRPSVSAEEKRAHNAERQRRFRERRKAELYRLRRVDRSPVQSV